jgi:hypothetical protein
VSNVQAGLSIAIVKIQSAATICIANPQPYLHSIISNFSQPFESIMVNIIAGALLKIVGK